MLLAFDGGSLLYRMVYAHTKHGLSSGSQGTGALFFLAKSLRAYMSGLRPRKAIMVMDHGYSDRRRAISPTYKSGRGTRVDADTDEERKAILEDIRKQRVWAERMIPALGIRSIKIRGREADDILAVMAKRQEEKGERMVLVSDDKDMLQLVGPNVEVFRPRADETIDHTNFMQMTGIRNAEEWLVWKCIVGDNSDKVPGVQGVGAKTAIQAVNEGINSFDVETLLSAADHKNWRVRKIADELDTVLFNRDLLDLYAEEFPPENLERIRAAVEDGQYRVSPKDVAKWFRQFEFNSLMDDLAQWLVPFDTLT